MPNSQTPPEQSRLHAIEAPLSPELPASSGSHSTFPLTLPAKFPARDRREAPAEAD
jgi:hypothetical protein